MVALLVVVAVVVPLVVLGVESVVLLNETKVYQIFAWMVSLTSRTAKKWQESSLYYRLEIYDNTCI